MPTSEIKSSQILPIGLYAHKQELDLRFEPVFENHYLLLLSFLQYGPKGR